MLVLGIYIATTHVWHHVYKFQFNHSGHITPVLGLAGALFCSKLQIYARCKSYLVIGITVVTRALIAMVVLPLVERFIYLLSALGLFLVVIIIISAACGAIFYAAVILRCER